MRRAGRGLGWSLLTIVLSAGLIALLGRGRPRGAAVVLIELGTVAIDIAAIAIPFHLLCLMTAPLFRRLERQRTRALACGKSLARLRFQLLLAALLVALACAAGMKPASPSSIADR